MVWNYTGVRGERYSVCNGLFKSHLLFQKNLCPLIAVSLDPIYNKNFVWTAHGTDLHVSHLCQISNQIIMRNILCKASNKGLTKHFLAVSSDEIWHWCNTCTKTFPISAKPFCGEINFTKWLRRDGLSLKKKKDLRQVYCARNFSTHLYHLERKSLTVVSQRRKERWQKSRLRVRLEQTQSLVSAVTVPRHLPHVKTCQKRQNSNAAPISTCCRVRPYARREPTLRQRIRK